jgi:hypothetical protein
VDINPPGRAAAWYPNSFADQLLKIANRCPNPFPGSRSLEAVAGDQAAYLEDTAGKSCRDLMRP